MADDPRAEWLLRLAAARDCWRLGTEENDNSRRRAACAAQLWVAADMIRRELDDHTAAEPLSALLSALAYIERGGRHSLFEPPARDARGGRPPVEPRIAAQRATAAAAMHLLMESGVRRKEAAQRVIRILAAADLNLFGAPESVARAALIRHRTRMNDGGQTTDQRFFKKCVREAAEGTTPLAGAEFLLSGFGLPSQKSS